jgi:hypothetical protein
MLPWGSHGCNAKEINDMLGGDKSLKNYLLKANEETEKENSKRSIFEENREKIETFYRTNITDIIEGKSKLAEARERFEFKKQEYCVNKELSYEMDPFKWDLVKDIDGKTKVRIIEELDDENNNPNEETLPDEETLAVEHGEPLKTEQEEEVIINYPITFQERRTVIEKYFKSELEWWRANNNFIRTTTEENERIRGCYIQTGRNMNDFENYAKRFFYFTRSSIGRVHIQTTPSFEADNYRFLYKEDPEWEKKRIKYWGDNVGAIL